MIYLFTGEHGSGKTTLANLLKTALTKNNPNREVELLDDELMKKILDFKRYQDQGIRNYAQQVYAIALYLNFDGDRDIIISINSPFRDLRNELKFSARVAEIYTVNRESAGTDIQQIQKYEPPFSDFIELDITGCDQFTSLNELLEKIEGFER